MNYSELANTKPNIWYDQYGKERPDQDALNFENEQREKGIRPSPNLVDLRRNIRFNHPELSDDRIEDILRSHPRYIPPLASERRRTK